jgi:hypothetical protein
MSDNLDQSIKMINEDKILTLCARTQLTPEIKVKLIKLLKKDLDWDYLIQKALHHKIMPLLYWNLKNYPKYVPENRFNSIKGHLKRIAQNNLLLYGELLKFLELFKSANIITIPYKGPILAIQVYGELTLRQFGDLDIFIFKEDVFKVTEILIAQGYKPDFNINDKNGERYISSQRELKFINPLKKTTIEIHWKFSGLFFSFPNLTENILQENLKTIYISNKSIITPSNEDLLLILCLHNASHHWTCLEWISDISELINNTSINWSIVIEKADKLCIKRILYINLSLTHDLLDLDLTKELLDDINSDSTMKNIVKDLKENLLENKNQKGLLWEVMVSIKIRENIKYGIKDCIKGLTNPSFYEFNSFPLPYYLFPLYYLYRPINLIKRFKFFK